MLVIRRVGKERGELLYKFELLVKACGIAHLKKEMHILQNQILNIHSEHSRKYSMEAIIRLNPQRKAFTNQKP